MDKAVPDSKPAGNAIHAWFATLDGGAAATASDANQRWRALLSQDELERAAWFKFDLDRNRYIAARGMLRLILGRYVGTQPDRLMFRYGVNGKPVLTDDGLHFNLSHCEDRMLIAVSSTAPLGIDLERVREMPEMARMAAEFFAPAETQALGMYPPSRYAEAFFKCWTRKEAFVKALGDGLSFPLDRFSVSLDEPARLRDLEGDAAEAAKWFVYPLRPDAGYAAAIVTRQPDAQVTLRNFSTSSHR